MGVVGCCSWLKGMGDDVEGGIPYLISVKTDAFLVPNEVSRIGFEGVQLTLSCEIAATTTAGELGFIFRTLATPCLFEFK